MELDGTQVVVAVVARSDLSLDLRPSLRILSARPLPQFDRKRLQLHRNQWLLLLQAGRMPVPHGPHGGPEQIHNLRNRE